MGKELIKRKNNRHAPLAMQINDDAVAKVRAVPRVKTRDVSAAAASDGGFIDDKLSQRILKQARYQQQEMEEEHNDDNSSSSRVRHKKHFRLGGSSKDTVGGETKKLMTAEDSDSDDVASDGEAEGGDELFDNLQIDTNDMEMLEKFMPTERPEKSRTLADVIMEKIKEKHTEIASQMSEAPMGPASALDEKVVNVYSSVGKLLSRYRSGKLPKPFKIIPALNNWEEILFLTNVDGWSAAAVYAATKIFASNLNARMAQRFFHLVLYPRVRDDIGEFKKLNYHLYQALKKAMFKPAAFFKGILLPLCESKDCTLKEAVIVGSVLTKVSIPMFHSAAALLKIAEMEYTGAVSIFIRVLLDKKYALPYRVIDALIFHFIRFASNTQQMPVLWHQSLLIFVQRYKEDITGEQKDALLELMRNQTHHTITEEIRREIVFSKSRDLEMAIGMAH